APAGQRYSFQFDGLLQTLDHMLVTPGIAAQISGFEYAHLDNDYFDRFSPNDGHKTSDHDPPIVTLGGSTPVVPESPMAVLLPVTSGLLLAAAVAFLVVRRRRHATA